MHINKPDYYNNLDKIYLKIWNLLNFGLKNRNSPLHIPVFISGSNNKFDSRIESLEKAIIELRKEVDYLKNSRE